MQTSPLQTHIEHLQPRNSVPHPLPFNVGPEGPLLTWDTQGLPHSVIFDDKYFCKENGFEETIHVSCKGNALPKRFAKLDPNGKGTFTIIETGFGTGLSFCAAWKVWQKCAPKSWDLHFVSIELYPLPSEDIARALSLWPSLSDYPKLLLAQYKPQKEGMIDLYFKDSRVRLTLVFDDVVVALKNIHRNRLTQGADAWFLNGFAPAKNPKMWSDEVFEHMAPLSKKGTTLSTFTVAGFVRRGLEAQGFEVAKIKGYGEKKHILTGIFKN